MQYFELILILLSALYAGLHRRITNYVKAPYVVGLLMTMLGIHLVAEGYRWQMIPGYLVWLIALGTALKQGHGPPSAIGRIFRSAVLLILLVPSLLLPYLLPVFDLPRPAGPYTVGTREIHLELDREEPITNDKTDTRQIMIKAWYPAAETGGEMDHYADPAGRNGFARKYGLPPFMLDYLDKVETHVYNNIPVADEPFPILIFSHGYNSMANGYYALLSEIVSHGYVVFAVNHTYESTGTTFPDGTNAYFDYEYKQKIESGTWETITPVIEAFENGLSFEERHPIVKKALTTYFARDIVERWAHDLVDVANQLETWNRTGFLEGKLDVSRVGAFGHSRGGGAAGEAVIIDSRIKAGANLDGVQWGQIVTTAFQKPFLFLSSDWPDDHENLIPHAYINRSKSVFYEGIILQSGHSNFMDIPYMVPLRAVSQAGAIDPDLAIEIATNAVLSFFDNHLKNKATDMHSLNSEYDFLELSIYKGDSLHVQAGLPK